MGPCELNTLVMAITNHLYSTLTVEEFRCLNVFISELGKSMFSMTLFRDICGRDKKCDD